MPASFVTICIPSNRPLATAKASLESAIRFAEIRGYRVVISDNSGEGAKLAYFSNLPAHVTYLCDPTRSATHNLLACMDATYTEFVLPLGDDDHVEAIEGIPAFDFAALGPDIAGVRPVLDVFAVGEGTLRTHTFTIEAETPADRMHEYRQKIGGDNTLYYSYFRRSDFRELIQIVENHPLAIGDMDWALVYALVGNGKVLLDPSTRLSYDIGKWRWTEGITASVEAIYRTAGLPQSAIAFEYLFRFLDCYVFAFRRTARQTEIERIKILYASAVIFLGRLLHESETRPQAFIGYEREIGMLRAVLKEPDDYLVNVFEVCAEIAERFKPGVHENYIRWFAAIQNMSEAG